MITLYRYFPAWGFGCVSQFVLKMDTYLRMTELPFQTVSLGLGQAAHSPKGKVPFIEHKGQKIGDSTFIIEYLKKEFGDKLDNGLTAGDRATALGIRRILEENTRWLMACERWNSPDEPYYHTTGFQELPRAVYEQVRDNYVRQLKEHGMAMHTEEELAQIGKADIDALETFLGDKKFFLGDRPTSVDATAYGFLAHMLRPAYGSRLKSMLEPKKNLVGYVERMRERFFQNDPISKEREVPMKA